MKFLLDTDHISILRLFAPPSAPRLRSGRIAQQQNAQARALLLRAQAAPRARHNRRNRQIYPILHMSFHARTAKIGAPLPIWRARRGARLPRPVYVKSYRRQRCNRVRSARSPAKWRFRPSKKRHFPSSVRHFFDDFPRVFSRACA